MVDCTDEEVGRIVEEDEVIGGDIDFGFDFGGDAVGDDEFLASADEVVFVVENGRHIVLQGKTNLLFSFFYFFLLLHL